MPRSLLHAVAAAKTKSYGPRSVAKPSGRARRSPDQMQALRDAIYALAKVDHPMTIRSLFYRLVTSGVVEKTEQAYKGVGRVATEMRRECDLPFEWFEDGTRWMRKSVRYSGLEAALERTASFYRRELWSEADVHVEVWVEKDAVAGVVFNVTDQYDVPLMVCRGYPSVSFLHNAASTIEGCGKPAFLYYLGDRDPSGLDISRCVEDGIREFAPTADVTFERLAVTLEQIALYELPTRPTKLTDSRSRGFEGESVELDAIPSGELRGIVERAIVQHVDAEHVRRLEVVEKEERATLAQMAKRLPANLGAQP